MIYKTILIFLIFLINHNVYASEETQKVRILFYYLPHLLESFENDPSLLRNEIQKRVNVTTQAFQNTKLDVKFTIAGLLPWHQPVSNSLWPEYKLPDIYKEFKPEAQALWKDGVYHKYGADFLVLLDSQEIGDQYCGWAPIGTQKSLEDPSYTLSFALVRFGPKCRANNKTLAHEIGHALGSAHEKEYNLLANYYTGYAVRCGTKNTIMHTQFPRHSFFSNPSITVDGEPCGHVDEADNFKLFSARIPLLANNTSYDGEEDELISYTSQGGSLDEAIFAFFIFWSCFYLLDRKLKKKKKIGMFNKQDQIRVQVRGQIGVQSLNQTHDQIREDMHNV